MQNLLLNLMNNVGYEDFVAYVKLLQRSKRDENSCLIAAAVYDFGYAKGGNTTAHRLSWRVNKGAIPENMFVCHTCDNPACHEITHLFLGTAGENAKDKAAKGRSVKGSAHPGSVLTEEAVRTIKADLRDGVKVSVIARKNNVERSTIYAIKRGETWKHVTA